MSDATRARPRYVTWTRVVRQNLGPVPLSLRAVYAYCNDPNLDGDHAWYKELLVVGLQATVKKEYIRPRAGKYDRGDPPAAPSPETTAAEGYHDLGAREWVDALVIRDGMILSHRDVTDDLCHSEAAPVVPVGPGQDAAAAGQRALAELRKVRALRPSDSPNP